MDKKAEMLNAVNASLARCCKSASFYLAGNISDKRFRNACKSYAGPVELSECIGMTDETTFGSGKKGFLFTYDGFYASGIQGLKRYTAGPQFKDLPGLYDLDAVNDLLGRLHTIAKGIPDPDAFLAQLTALAGQVLKAPVQDPAQMRRSPKEWDAAYVETFYALCGWLDRMLDEVVDVLYAADFPSFNVPNHRQLVERYFQCFFHLAACLTDDRVMLEVFEHAGLTTAQQNAFEATAQVLALLQVFLTQYESDSAYFFDLAGAVKPFHSGAVDLAAQVYGLPSLETLGRAFAGTKAPLASLRNTLAGARKCMTLRFDVLRLLLKRMKII